MKWLRVLLRLCVLWLALGIVQGLFHRDPYVDLGNGYAISATSWGEPCRLLYFRVADKRPDSGWQGHISDGRYTLSRPGHNSPTLVFESETEWRRACRERNARPSFTLDDKVQDITRFKQKDHFVIGQCAAGLFLLDTDANSLETWKDNAEWERTALSQAGMTTDNMVSPKASSVQSWDEATYWALAITALILTTWALAPLWSKRRRAATSSDVAKAQS